MRLPVFISTAATDPVLSDLGNDDGEELVSVVALVVQRTRPLASDKTRSDVSLVTTREGADEEMAGVSRLATPTMVNWGMLLYYMPRYSFSGVELDGEKKPKAKSPPSDMTVVPGKSGLPAETSRSSEEAHRTSKRRRATVQTDMKLMNPIRSDFLMRRLWLSGCSQNTLVVVEMYTSIRWSIHGLNLSLVYYVIPISGLKFRLK